MPPQNEDGYSRRRRTWAVIGILALLPTLMCTALPLAQQVTPNTTRTTATATPTAAPVMGPTAPVLPNPYDNQLARDTKRMWPMHYTCSRLPADTMLRTSDLVPGAQAVATFTYRWRLGGYEVTADPRITITLTARTLQPNGTTRITPQQSFVVEWTYARPLVHFGLYELRHTRDPEGSMAWVPVSTKKEKRYRYEVSGPPINGMYPALTLVATDPGCHKGPVPLPATFDWNELAGRGWIGPF